MLFQTPAWICIYVNAILYHFSQLQMFPLEFWADAVSAAGHWAGLPVLPQTPVVSCFILFSSLPPIFLPFCPLISGCLTHPVNQEKYLSLQRARMNTKASVLFNIHFILWTHQLLLLVRFQNLMFGFFCDICR